MQKVDYLVRTYLPETPCDLTVNTSSHEVRYFFLPVGENSIEQIVYGLYIVHSSKISTYQEKKWTAWYKVKLQTICMETTDIVQGSFFDTS